MLASISLYVVTRGGFEKLILSTPVGGDFKISTTQGEFDTKEERGRTLLLFFGFTNCPHVCPLTLSNLNAMMNMMTPEEKAKYKVLFISIDPERDSLEVLAKRLAPYNGNIIGATDKDEKLHRIVRLFGARYTRVQKTPDAVPFVDHTSDIFIINDKGEWVDSMKFDSSAEEFLAAARNAGKKTPRSLGVKKVRMVQVLGENKNCDVGKATCKEIIQDGEVELKLGPQPVTTEKDLVVSVKSTSKEWTPTEVDFEGISLNMGLIRPSLKSTGGKTVTKDRFIFPCVNCRRCNGEPVLS